MQSSQPMSVSQPMAAEHTLSLSIDFGGSGSKVHYQFGGGMLEPAASVEFESSSTESDSSLIPGQVEAGFMGNLFG